MSEKDKEEVNSFKESVKQKALELVSQQFPHKILNLDIISNSDEFSFNSGLKSSDINIPIPDHKSKESSVKQKAMKNGEKSSKKMNVFMDSDDDDDLIIAKAFLFPNGAVESNNCFTKMMETVKSRMIELTEDILLLKLGISLMVPKIEDGNNFGVEVQQETIEAINSVETEVLNKFDSFENYYEARGDLIAKVAKYPHDQDFRVAIQECDQRFHLNLCLTLTDIRNHYINLHDLVTKNINKIKNPRTQDNKDFLY
ncbi:proteasome activator complex subunit 3-like [Oppia nitens]|uniref:proteasome activator complex subunit 3-like n=1 Tax=Oppia nitens TaxID=1686743 RepID=UPI0023DBE9AF|nr:proteasome activator complex subunit 3-like [Oppia nitens]